MDTQHNQMPQMQATPQSIRQPQMQGMPSQQQMPQNSQGTRTRKKPGMGIGILIGWFAGSTVLTVVLLCVIVGYCAITGKNIVLGPNNTLAPTSLGTVLDGDTIDKIKELSAYINIYFYDEYDKEDLQEGMLHGLVSGLGDQYSVYYTPEEYADTQVNTTGTYYGIGAGLTQDPDTMQVTITRVYEGTPAEEAGLLKEDILLYVEDIDATTMELSPLVQHIRGEEGTNVHLKIYRPSTNEELEFDVERRNVELPSVTSQLLEGNIGYIEITEFQEKTGDQFEQKLAELEAQGMEALIVDVRSNPGGLVSSVVQVLDVLLPKGIVVYTEDKYGNRQDYTSDEGCVDYPIVVLMDEYSASASEIFAGAIKDYEYGTLIGTTTFGKGIVQTIIPLEDGDAVKLTTAKYFTPNGSYIHGTGISPDIELPYEFLGTEGESYAVEYDNQIQKAIEVLTEELK